MKRSESIAKRNLAIALFKQGASLTECAKATGYVEDYVRQVLTKCGLWVPKCKRNKEREQLAINMLKDGYSPKAIICELGYANETRVYEIAREHGISVQWKRMQMGERDEDMRKFKAEGHSHKEVAEKFGVSLAVSHKACKGIAPQMSAEISRKRATEQNEKTYNEREEKAKAQVTQLGYEYMGGYTNTDGYVRVRCLKCGAVFERSMVSVRHLKPIHCPGCAELEKEEQQKAEEAKRIQAKQERLRVAEEKKREAEAKRRAKLHKCPVCGELTTRPKYCSATCSHKASNTSRDAKRRIKIKNAMVDKDITIERLYERDNGICYLCGCVCDWDDKVTKGETVICGDMYPSIDHVVPLSKGGSHSWQNVKLAHRICNTLKGANV